jgi:NAD(P)-dependent dehydrogenase (short-subunit alcohol dehydrogenase family)
MLEQKSGSIINVSSAYGHIGAPGDSVYVASKHAVEGPTKSAVLEVGGRGVRVNAVAPGPMHTEMVDRFTGGAEGKAFMASELALKRLGKPEEVAQSIVFMASDKASFMTGHSLSVDGGRPAS